MALTDINAVLPRKEYTASAGQTVFTVPFEFLADADLKVYQIPSGVTPDDATHILTLTTDYTVVGAGVSDPGTREITLVTGATLNDTIIIEGEDEIDRDTAFLANGDLTIAAMNLELNKLILLNKQLSMLIKHKTIQFQDSAILDAVDLTLPNPVASKLLGWNTSGDEIINVSQYVEKYYGEFAAPPATNPHTGAAPVTGDMYYDTTLGLTMVYNGATWGQINSSVATAANAVNIADAGAYYASTEVESALQEIFTLLASNSNGEGASFIGIEDAGTDFAATDVEDALNEANARLIFNNSPQGFAQRTFQFRRPRASRIFMALHRVTPPAGADDLRLQIGSSSAWVAANYRNIMTRTVAGGTTTFRDDVTTYIPLNWPTIMNAADEVSGTIEFLRLDSLAHWWSYTINLAIYRSGANSQLIRTTGYTPFGAADIDRIQIYTSAGGSFGGGNPYIGVWEIGGTGN